MIKVDYVFRSATFLHVSLVAFAIVAIVTIREDVVLATPEKIVGVAIGVGPRAVNEAKSV